MTFFKSDPMNLIQIITLYNRGKLPANPAILRSCLKVLTHADGLAFDCWRHTSNPLTARMLEIEQIRYEVISKHIQAMLETMPARRKTFNQSPALQSAL